MFPALDFIIIHTVSGFFHNADKTVAVFFFIHACIPVTVKNIIFDFRHAVCEMNRRRRFQSVFKCAVIPFKRTVQRSRKIRRSRYNDTAGRKPDNLQRMKPACVPRILRTQGTKVRPYCLRRIQYLCRRQDYNV